MSIVPSATRWGSPTATKHALLVHGLTSSSHTWHKVAQALVAEGYLVTAPNLLGHVSRWSNDYRIRNIAEDILPLLSGGQQYDLVIAHSMGSLVTLNLLPFFSRSKIFPIILIDPPLEQDETIIAQKRLMFTDAITNIKNPEFYMEQNPRWSREDAVWRVLATRLVDPNLIQFIYQHNSPWSFSHLFGTVPPNIKMTVLLADPKMNPSGHLKDIQPYSHIRTQIVPGAAHWIQQDFPDVVVDVATKAVKDATVKSVL
ncbi:Alpha/Beta hydrolase protein [Hygrophoropsis aurantiaca]|uniref:Alpha/Beta hydrolase protein n=1 Tax=Hygrophoropsis aurantiaca TaxID=72124 RepID=A0ACB8ASZ1_9AGAM|nr:Alpha/Beta hydrolase protein [Hygrophoropsis aurantiaca]